LSEGVALVKTSEIKNLVEKHSPAQLESCIAQQLEKGENLCNIVDQTDTVIAELSKAAVIRELMNTGMSFSEALRELARRIRAVYGSGEK
jgi:cell fate (sporulation/competence/biofilm development) regulator YmcA (YheA/YmcA/DUF963 family)